MPKPIIRMRNFRNSRQAHKITGRSWTTPPRDSYPFHSRKGALGLGLAALGGAMFSPHMGEAQIVYQDLDPDVLITRFGPASDDVIATLDIDEDGSPDFRFWESARSYGVGIRMNGLNDSWSMAGSRFVSFFNSCTEGMVQNGPAGRTIDGNLDFKNVGRLWINTFPCGDICNWEAGEDGYIALRRQDSTGMRYGWMRVQRTDLPASGAFELLDYALQSTPGLPIRAGDPGDTCFPVESLVGELLPSIPSLVQVVSLNWSKVPRALGYRLEITRDLSTMTYSRVKNKLVVDQVPPGNYSIRVQAECPSGPGDWSPTVNLTVFGLRAEEEASQPDHEWTIRQLGGTPVQLHWSQGPEQVEWALLNLQGAVLSKGSGASNGSCTLPASWPSGWYLFEVQGQNPNMSTMPEQALRRVIRVWKP